MTDHPAKTDPGTHTACGFAESWLVSLAFWIALVVAAALYAAVALSPKLLSYLTLHEQYVSHQQQLVWLERQVQYLEKVGQALEHEPEFAAELARVDLDAARAGDERLPVDPEHRLHARWDAASAPLVAQSPWYAPAVRTLAGHSRLRAALLMTAAACAVFAFAFLHERYARRLKNVANWTRSGVGRLAARYRKA